MSDAATKEKAGQRAKEILDSVFPKGVETTPDTKGHELVMKVKWPRPVEGRPLAAAWLNIVITEEALQDCFDQEHIIEKTNHRFINFIQGKLAHYLPSPSLKPGAPSAETWVVTTTDLCVGD
jgi:hypothetical protein